MSHITRFTLAGLALLTLAVVPVHAAPLAVGTMAPNYTLPDQNNKTHTLSKERGHVVLLAFYPADMTTGCTIEAHELSAAYPQLKKMGVRVFGISVQDPKSHKEFCEKDGIPYTLLADTQKTTAQSYGVLMPQGFADRVTYIVGKDGKLAYVDPNVNGHLLTCAQDWINWLNAHPAVLHGKK